MDFRKEVLDARGQYPATGLAGKETTLSTERWKLSIGVHLT
jgi:hypothetical protein